MWKSILYRLWYPVLIHFDKNDIILNSNYVKFFIIDLYILKSEAHVTKGFSIMIQIRPKFGFSVTLLLGTMSLQKFAHDMSA